MPTLRHGLLLLLLALFSMFDITLAVSPCSALVPSDGLRVYRATQLFYSMLYPYTFIIRLYPGQRCYYIADKLVQAKWTNQQAVTGMVYEYGYRGWDGRDKNTCSLTQQMAINQNKMYYTSESRAGKADVCGYVMFFSNTASDESGDNAYVTIITNQALKVLVYVVSIIPLVGIIMG
ncbi:hypothetical protein FGO68_gene14431 [Halteria grandinella]|uniref:Uncharacterized protein n=1 Tax=Halteria grandinella TaxID=5974 RepID=A0A8J8NEJ1_HALGN|nr:hypothetical protein FGO68_gene14431 [Halteria grandinella]